jgi:hypothetical protein
LDVSPCSFQCKLIDIFSTKQPNPALRFACDTQYAASNHLVDSLRGDTEDPPGIVRA